MTETIRSRAVLHAVLLRTLAQHIEGLPIQDAYDAVHTQYTFPSDWYREIPRADGYDALAALGVDDWREVPQERLIELVKTEPQWQNELRWTRNDLRQRGLLDMSAPRGIWKLTAEGLRAAQRPEESAQLRPEEVTLATPRPRPRPMPNLAKPAPGDVPVPGFRDSLMRKLDALTASMPLDDLELLIDIARIVRTRSIPLETGT